MQQDCASRWPFADNFLDTVFSNFFEHLPVKKTLENSWGGHAMSGAERPVVGSRPEYQDLPGQYWDFFDHHLAFDRQVAGGVWRKRDLPSRKAFLAFSLS